MRSALHGATRIGRASAPFIVLLFVLFLVAVVGAAQPIVRTNTGAEYTGSLSGLAPVIRLNVPPGTTFVGPAQAFDIPLSSITQITVDFPRVVIETPAQVYVGPYSAYSGIQQKIEIHGMYDDTTVDFASVRAISLTGDAIHPVPHEWLGDGFLVISLQPKPILGAKPAPTETVGTEGLVSTPSGETTEAQSWTDLYPPTTEEQTATEATPWWIGLIVVAALAVVVYFFMNR